MSAPEVFSSTTLRLPTTPECLDTVSELIGSIWQARPGVDLADRLAFETAVMEVAANVVQHSGAGPDVLWSIRLTATDDRLAAEVTDLGLAAEVDLAQPALPDALAESGRGLALVWALVDELRYTRERGVNNWRLTRLLKRDIA